MRRCATLHGRSLNQSDQSKKIGNGVRSGREEAPVGLASLAVSTSRFDELKAQSSPRGSRDDAWSMARVAVSPDTRHRDFELEFRRFFPSSFWRRSPRGPGAFFDFGPAARIYSLRFHKHGPCRNGFGCRAKSLEKCTNTAGPSTTAHRHSGMAIVVEPARPGGRRDVVATLQHAAQRSVPATPAKNRPPRLLKQNRDLRNRVPSLGS
jgi:hypothetical protein